MNNWKGEWTRILLGFVLIVTGPFFSALALVNSAHARSLVSGCDRRTPWSVPSVGQSRAVRFDCNSMPAFSATGTATPVFSIASTGYNSLAIVLHSSPNCTQANPLQSGVKVTFGSARLDYDYCAFFTDAFATELGTFDIEWSIGRTK